MSNIYFVNNTNRKEYISISNDKFHKKRKIFCNFHEKRDIIWHCSNWRFWNRSSFGLNKWKWRRLTGQETCQHCSQILNLSMRKEWYFSDHRITNTAVFFLHRYLMFSINQSARNDQQTSASKPIRKTAGQLRKQTRKQNEWLQNETFQKQFIIWHRAFTN